ncbi:MAG: cytochrome-c peroxidase [Robiginitomaculum sp.]|nr:MAG: cytochrome-c peroxidase [Robiginitomaculum sp.]
MAGCGGGNSATTSVTPTPTSTNQAPVVASANADQAGNFGFDFSYDATQSGTTFSDVNGDTLSYSVAYAPSANGLTDTAGVISGVVSANEDISVTITAADGNGGSVSDTFSISVTIDQSSLQAVFGGRIDLEALSNYANQPVPGYIRQLNEGGNPITDAGATLGRVLFYDTALSITDGVSCASCHLQARGFSDPNVVSAGVEGGVTGRHSMRLINTQFAEETKFFWDERAASHEIQETQPLQDHNEMGFSGQGGRPGLATLFAKLEAIEYYEELFRFVYLDPEITEEKLQFALAQFTKSIYSFDSRFDAGRAVAGDVDPDFNNFTVDENAGKTLFLNPPNQGGAGCRGCHRPPEFDVDPNSGHNGVVGVANASGSFDFTVTRSPSLRDVVDPNGGSNGPFMHDGSLQSLNDVVDHYNAIQDPTGGNPNFFNGLDNRLSGPNNNLQRLNLTQAQKDQIVAFLGTLSGSNLYTDVKYSDPF